MTYWALVLFLLNPVTGNWEEDAELAETRSKRSCYKAMYALGEMPNFPQTGAGLACRQVTRA